MRPTLEDGLRALAESAELAKSIRIELDADYLRAIVLVEALPKNQSGADKSWMSRLVEESARHLARAVRVR
jgi:hypothetical protein